MPTLSSLYGPPLYLGEALFSKATDPAARLKRANARLLLRGEIPGALPRPVLLVLVLLWPATALVTALIGIVRYGGLVKARSGKGRLRQLGEMLVLAFRHSCPPQAYTRYDLYVPANYARAQLYLHRCETKHSLFGYINENLGCDGTAVFDKEVFEERCRHTGIPTVPVVAAAHEGVLNGAAELERLLAGRSWFVKPSRGKGGRGIERWDAMANGSHRRADGRVLDGRAFMQRLRRRALKHDFIVQPRVVNHPVLDALGVPALSTVRIMTVLNERRDYEVVSAVIRMAVDNETVDNFHGGGVAAPVDLATGELGAAIGMLARSARVDAHPRSGARIEGLKLPHWDEIKTLVVSGHEGFSELVVIGWDVAITPSGPIILEANHRPGINILQRPYDAPLGPTRLSELIAYHVHQIELVRRRKQLLARARTRIRVLRALRRLGGVWAAGGSRVDVFIVSFPKCGRTWLRVQIGRALQQHFGLEVDDLIDLEAMTKIDPRVPRLRIKHIDKPQRRTPAELSKGLVEAFRRKKVVFLVRDPRDVVVSIHAQKTKRGMRPFFEGGLSEFIREPIGSLDTLLAYYRLWGQLSENNENFLIVRYEDMHEDPERELHRVLSFIGLSDASPETVREAVAFSSFDRMREMERCDQMKNRKLRPVDPDDEESFKTRKGKAGGYAETLDEADIAYADNLIQASQQTLFDLVTR
jgi:hypothetical protein